MVKLCYGKALDMFNFTELSISHIFFKFLEHIKVIKALKTKLDSHLVTFLTKAETKSEIKLHNDK